jgi:NTE family protein
MKLVDGGVLNNLPVDLLKQLGAQVSFAVNVAPRFNGGTSDPPPSLARLPVFAFDVYLTVLLMTTTMTQRSLQQRPPDLLLEPEIPVSIGLFSGFTHPQEVITLGEQAAVGMLERIKKLLQ